MPCTRESRKLETYGCWGFQGTDEVALHWRGGPHRLCLKPREDAASVKPRHTPHPCHHRVYSAAASFPSPGLALGKCQRCEGGAKWKMTADRRQTTAPPGPARTLQGRGPWPHFWGTLRAPAPHDCHNSSRGSAHSFLCGEAGTQEPGPKLRWSVSRPRHPLQVWSRPQLE